jgi:peptide/nickel transport system permease protein
MYIFAVNFRERGLPYLPTVGMFDPEAGKTPAEVLRHMILPVATLSIIGLDLPILLAGAIVTEQIFAWPGMGRLFLDHLKRADFPMLMGILMFLSVAVVVFQLITDVVYSFVDPRIRLE